MSGDTADLLNSFSPITYHNGVDAMAPYGNFHTSFSGLEAAPFEEGTKDDSVWTTQCFVGTRGPRNHGNSTTHRSDLN
ncbi:hypothetical protein Plhal304r1_c095g0173401 [Plasmopara halstedii]